MAAAVINYIWLLWLKWYGLYSNPPAAALRLEDFLDFLDFH